MDTVDMSEDTNMCALVANIYLINELSVTIALMRDLVCMYGKGHSNTKYPQQKYFTSFCSYRETIVKLISRSNHFASVLIWNAIENRKDSDGIGA